MHSTFKNLRFCLLTLAIVPVLGCGDANSWLATAEQLRGEVVEPEPDSAPERVVTAATKPFEPINAGRVNAFTYAGRFATAEERAFSNGLSKVVVKGFAKTDRPTVFVQVGTQSYMLHQGDEAAGIEVLEIAPPTVTLKSKSSVWTASMFD